MTHPSARQLEHLWGCGDLDELFHGGDRAILPWPRLAPRRGPSAAHQRAVDLAALTEFVHGPTTLTEIDPRCLTATQPWLIRHHALYYVTGQWELTGLTSADRHSLLNRQPVISLAGTQLVIRSGHHRAFAALIEGRRLMARLHDGAA